MKTFVRNSIAIFFFSLPLIATAQSSSFCGAGIIKGLAEGYDGKSQTRILLDTKTGSGSSTATLPWDTAWTMKVDTLQKTLRAGFLSGLQVGLYSATYTCNKITEVRICHVAADCK